MWRNQNPSSCGLLGFCAEKNQGREGDNMLRFYFEVARTAYRRQLIYRWANLAGLCTNVFFCIVLSSVIIAL
jgi:hypothetical protein